LNEALSSAYSDGQNMSIHSPDNGSQNRKN